MLKYSKKLDYFSIDVVSHRFFRAFLQHALYDYSVHSQRNLERITKQNDKLVLLKMKVHTTASRTPLLLKPTMYLIGVISELEDLIKKINHGPDGQNKKCLMSIKFQLDLIKTAFQSGSFIEDQNKLYFPSEKLPIGLIYKSNKYDSFSKFKERLYNSIFRGRKKNFKWQKSIILMCKDMATCSERNFIDIIELGNYSSVNLTPSEYLNIYRSNKHNCVSIKKSKKSKNDDDISNILFYDDYVDSKEVVSKGTKYYRNLKKIKKNASDYEKEFKIHNKQ
ncbi:MAG: hypothetical protein ACOYOK_10655 [Pseudobdellovibrionaceae bacterium]